MKGRLIMKIREDYLMIKNYMEIKTEIQKNKTEKTENSRSMMKISCHLIKSRKIRRMIRIKRMIKIKIRMIKTVKIKLEKIRKKKIRMTEISKNQVIEIKIPTLKVNLMRQMNLF